MSKPLHICAVLLVCLPAVGFAQQNPPLPEEVALPTTAAWLATAKGLITLDVVVRDKSGKPVAGLESKDFALLDNGQSQKILSFQAQDGVTAKPDPPVEVLLVIDALNASSAQQIEAEKSEAEKFLRANHGHLAQPVSIFLLSNAGLSSSRESSIDGNALAEEIALGGELPVSRQTPRVHVGQTHPAPGGIATSIGRDTRMTLQDVASRNSLRYLGFIVLEERRKPGRKLLFWLGPGWPFTSGPRCDHCFEWITEFSTRLREARITLWSAWPNLDQAVVLSLSGPQPLSVTGTVSHKR